MGHKDIIETFSIHARKRKILNTTQLVTSLSESIITTLQSESAKTRAAHAPKAFRFGLRVYASAILGSFRPYDRAVRAPLRQA